MKSQKKFLPDFSTLHPLSLFSSFKMLSQVVELIENKQNFAITTHVRPDGDGVGSSSGIVLAFALSGQNGGSHRPRFDSVSYQSLPGADEIRTVAEIDGNYDAVFVIECSDITRPGIKNLENQFTVNIDHHATSDHFGTINWIDATASAVGEMIYNLCKAIGGRVTKEIAECVYMALVTDTGSFHFPNTTERTLKVASELVKVGVKPAQISEAVYNSYPWSRIELMRQVLDTVKRDETGRVAWMRQTLEMTEKVGRGRWRQQRLRQYSARRQRSRSRRLHARRPFRTPIASACARKTASTSRASPKNSAAAGIKTRRAAVSKAIGTNGKKKLSPP